MVGQFHNYAPTAAAIVIANRRDLANTLAKDNLESFQWQRLVVG